VLKDHTDWTYADTVATDDALGHGTAFFKHVATDVGMPADFQTHATHYNCPGAEDGAVTCARHCAEELGMNLVAFQVTGLVAPPPPPNPPPPPISPSPPPSPLPPFGQQFNGQSDACTNAGLYHGALCKDGALRPPTPRWLARSHPPLCLRRWRRLGLPALLRVRVSGALRHSNPVHATLEPH
jgi:hypothetical protein